MDEASPDLWALGVQGDANRPVLDTSGLKALTCLTYVLDCLCVILQRRNRNGYNTYIYTVQTKTLHTLYQKDKTIFSH